MSTPSDNFKKQYAYFHSVGKTLTEESQFVFNSANKSGHVNFSNDILTNNIPYLSDSSSADSYASNNPNIVKKYTQYSLTELPGSNGQTWYIEDSGKWIKPILVPSLITESGTNEPSNGLVPYLYQSDNTFIPPTNGVFFIDAFQGIVKFEQGYTPSDMGWGNPKITCYTYVGSTLTESLIYLNSSTQSLTGGYTVTDSDYGTVVYISSPGIITLPASPDTNAHLWIKNKTVYPITLSGNGNNVEELSTNTISAKSCVHIHFDGTEWWVI